MNDDDVSWDMDDPALASEERRLLEGLRSALAVPASTSELAGSESSRQMYRRERDALADSPLGRAKTASTHRMGRVSPFLPAGAVLAVCLLLPTGTALAAYSGRLPAPVQGWAHTALGRVGVPARQHTTKPRPGPITPTPDVDRPGPRHKDSPVLQRRHSARPCPTIVLRQPITGHKTLPPANSVYGKGDRGASGLITPSAQGHGASKPSPTALAGSKIGVPASPRPVSPSSRRRPTSKPTPKLDPPPSGSPGRGPLVICVLDRPGRACRTGRAG